VSRVRAHNMRTVCKYTSVCVDVERHCAITKMINVSLLLLPGFGLTLSQCKQCRNLSTQKRERERMITKKGKK